MKMRSFGKLGIQGSALGFGCMRFNGPQKDGKTEVDEEKAIRLIRKAIDNGVTYFDTAYVYLGRNSECILGKALRDGYREKVTIATKMPFDAVHNREECDALLEEELNKLGTDHIDFYLLHGIDRKKWEGFKEMGIEQFFADKKAEGKIRFACFSTHEDNEGFKAILDDYDWDMVQIQYNFMDINNQAGTDGLQYAGKKGIPVVIMEGLLGGRLANAPDNVQALYDAFPVKRSAVEWAFRWLGNHPEVATVLSGMNEEFQLDENLEIFDRIEPGCMTQEEEALMDKVRQAYLDRTKIGCTGCRYCMPCPNGVDIPGLFSVWNTSSLYNEPKEKNWGWASIIKNDATPEKCVQCGACEAACPQHLSIIESLQTAWSELKD